MQILEKLNLVFGGFSSKGAKAENQDAFAAYLPKDHNLYSKGGIATIADGVSVCARAREASNTCATTFIQNYLQTPETWTVTRSVTQILLGLNRWCHGQHDYEHGGHSQMITTFTGMVFKSASGFIVHVGDTRIGRVQNKQYELLTKDHVSRQAGRDVLSRAVGIDAKLEVDFGTVELSKNDIYVFTSDGVHTFLPTKQMMAIILDEQLSLEQRATKIVESAIEQGSDDNATCLLVQVTSLPDASLDEHTRQLNRLAMPPALEVGMKLEGYRVIETVFNGSRSSLYKVINEQDGKVYGLKTPSQHFADDPVYLSGFLREEWVGQHIKHPNVMAIFKRPDDAKFMYHVCEYIEGKTLRQWMLDNPKPSIEQVRAIIGHVISALRILQRKDMVHRDVKPENVMLTRHSEVKLIDFGTVLVNALAETNSLPIENVAVGSVHYIAPEYLLTQRSDHKSDLFSLAVVIYEMLAGELPFKPFAYKDYIPTDYDEWQYRSIRQYRRDLPLWLDLALEKALSPNPKHRYAAFSELMMDLSKPNQNMLVSSAQQPLIKRNPILVYKGLCVVQFAVIVWLVMQIT